MKKILFVGMVLAMAISSCAKFENVNEGKIVNRNGDYAILFGSSKVATRATASSVNGNGYDDFALFTWNSIGDTIMNPYVVHAVGEGDYNYESSALNQELKYFKRVADDYSFIGIIPTTHKMGLSGSVVRVDTVKSFTVDDNRVTGAITADSDEEFLYAYKNVAKADYGNVVNLPFNHGNAVIYLGFKSDRNDTKLIDYVPGTPGVPATPDVNDTTDTWFNLKRSSGNVDGSATKTRVKSGETWGDYVDNYELPAALVNEIKSYYSVDGGAPGDYDLHMGNTVWPSSTIKQLRIVKAIPAEYKISFQIYNTDIYVDFFDGFKYLKDNGYDIQPRNSGGKPSVWDYVLIDAFVNGTAYTVVGLNASGSSYSVPQYTINVTPGTPAVPGVDPIEGVRLFTADSTEVYCKHIAHTLVADANVSASGCEFVNRAADSTVVTYTLPVNTTLGTAASFSPTTFYTIPGDENLNFLVVKLSYIYDGITAYDVRVPIKLHAGGLQQGKYYKYTLNITSTGNGTNDPSEATDEKDEIIIEGNPVIHVVANFTDYTEGADETITI